MVAMLLQRLLREEPSVRSSAMLLNLRLCIFSVAWVHLCVAAVVILPLDMSKDEDPRIRAYARLKWRFITALFNFINLAYFPLCIYIDWKEKIRQENEKRVCIIRKIRDVIFTCILFPTVLWADFMFWRLYWKDATLISPPHLFDYMPSWGQHSLHTVTLIVAILDLLITPRRRPESLKPRLLLMTAFFIMYCFVILERYVKGEMVYALLERFSGTEAILFVVMSYTEYLLYYTLQWYVIDWVWGARYAKKEGKVT